MSTIDTEAFHIESDKCISFPGPGDTLAMAENPMFEFFGAEGYVAHHQSHKVDRDFKEFKEKHTREYEDSVEEIRRKFHFHQNHR